MSVTLEMVFLYILNSDFKVHVRLLLITVTSVDKYDENKHSYTNYVYYTVPSQFETGSQLIFTINNFEFQKYLKFRLFLAFKERADIFQLRERVEKNTRNTRDSSFNGH
jgi:hypothetical protein